MKNEKLIQCPICNSIGLIKFIDSLDFFLSQKEFSIDSCTECGCKFTNPRPTNNDISEYYKSEDYLSHSNRKKGALDLIYHAARAINLRHKYNLIRQHHRGRRILDFGCGTGEFLAFCKGHTMEAKGLEPNAEAREFATQKHGIEVWPGLPRNKEEKPFDIITMWHSLEHIHDPVSSLNELKTFLDRDGLLLVALPNCDSWDAQHYGRFWAGYDLPRHLFHFNKRSFVFLADRCGFKLKAVYPQKMDSFYVSMLSEKYVKGRSDMPRAFSNGVRSNFYARKPEHGFSSQIFLLTHSK